MIEGCVSKAAHFYPTPIATLVGDLALSVRKQLLVPIQFQTTPPQPHTNTTHVGKSLHLDTQSTQCPTLSRRP
jgi:hypothetical protein